ncbi:restriction endonuclease [Pseudomarimonas arenosa]|uniref:DUF2034 domain-containing protein n=1 Tax=Pseudomarimonas arenosa TaxID=2774145 RepID=A0AAW3ZMW0_9GAMM|nr:restriction endonuclease [Pseudomarimonas arenosa]MBD8527078.1 DUF2034 domain-containing protein [Pseudomarimonas arenosa]
MPRRQTHFLEVLAKLPWPIGVAFGGLIWLGGLVIAPAVLAGSKSPVFSALATQLQTGTISLVVWAFAGACWIAALISFLGQGKRRRTLEAQKSLADIKALSWREFEQLVGEAFRRQGFMVTETGQGGADGGVDLLLQRDGKKRIVQCKQWKQQKVGVNIVREQFGLLTHHAAERAIIVSVGEFTPEARRFVEGKPIDLISGADLVALIQSVQTNVPAPAPVEPALSLPSESPPAPEPAVQVCPRCGSAMVERTARSSGSKFWGCSTFPACRGTRALV